MENIVAKKHDEDAANVQQRVVALHLGLEHIERNTAETKSKVQNIAGRQRKKPSQTTDLPNYWKLRSMAETRNKARNTAGRQRRSASQTIDLPSRYKNLSQPNHDEDTANVQQRGVALQLVLEHIEKNEDGDEEQSTEHSRPSKQRGFGGIVDIRHSIVDKRHTRARGWRHRRTRA